MNNKLLEESEHSLKSVPKEIEQESGTRKNPAGVKSLLGRTAWEKETGENNTRIIRLEDGVINDKIFNCLMKKKKELGIEEMTKEGNSIKVKKNSERWIERTGNKITGGVQLKIEQALEKCAK